MIITCAPEVTLIYLIVLAEHSQGKFKAVSRKILYWSPVGITSRDKAYVSLNKKRVDLTVLLLQVRSVVFIPFSTYKNNDQHLFPNYSE